MGDSYVIGSRRNRIVINLRRLRKMSENTHGQAEYSNNVGRRRFIQIAGGTGVIALAGCQGDDGGDGGGGGGDGGGSGGGGDGQPVANEFIADSWVVPSNFQVNRYNTANYSGQIAQIIFDPLARFDPVEGEFIPYLVEWEIGNDAVTLKLEEGRTWQNGDPVTADDLATKIKLDQYVSHPVWDYISGVEATDDRTVELTLGGEVNPAVLEHALFGDEFLDVKHSVFKEYLTSIEDASGDEEENKAISELLKFNWTDATGNGPFQWGETREQKGTMTAWDDHPQADSINFDQYSLLHTPSNQAHWESLIGGDLDATTHTLFMPEDTVNQLPDHINELVYPNYGGMGMTFNNDHKIWGQRAARRAMAYLINRPPVAKRSGGDTKKPVEIPHGTTQELAKNHFSDGLGDLETYEGSNPDRAAELFKEAGLQQSGDTWQYSDGSAFEPVLNVQSGASDWVAAVETILNQLNSFGINASIETIEDPTYWGSTLPNSDFEVAMNFWGGGIPHPFFGLRWSLASQAITEYNNFPTEIEVPGTIGDPGSNLETWNVGEMVNQLAQSSGDETSQLMAELAWAVNQTLPVLPIQEKLEQHFISSGDWDIPNPDSDVMKVKYPAIWLPRVGELQAKTE